MADKYTSRAKQKGVVLIIALIVLVAMTLAGIAMMRSVDTSNLIAGNLAFQQAATHSADTGVETAISWLESNAASSVLDSDDQTNGYAANGSSASHNPATGQTWDAYWIATLANRKVDLDGGAVDAAGNAVSYVIDRLCNPIGACVASPVITAATGNGEEAGEIQLNAPSVVYYRITVRVAGPKNTVSYVQTIISI